MYLLDNGIQAKSFSGIQAGIVTDFNFGDANILTVHTYALCEYLKMGGIAVVAGFQGLSSNSDITTLGRNGSDTTAIALAYALQAEKCVLYKKKVDGIFDRDPLEDLCARQYKYLNYKDLLNGKTSAIHEKGLKIIQEQAERSDMKIIVRNIDLTRHQITMIGREATEFYR